MMVEFHLAAVYTSSAADLTHSRHIYHNIITVLLIHTLKRRQSSGMQPLQGSSEGNGDAARTAGHSYESCEVWSQKRLSLEEKETEFPGLK